MSNNVFQDANTKGYVINKNTLELLEVNNIVFKAKHEEAHFDNCIEPGIYTVAATATGSPDSSVSGQYILFCIQLNEYLQQIAISPASGHTIYFRKQENQFWSIWQ